MRRAKIILLSVVLLPGVIVFVGRASANYIVGATNGSGCYGGLNMMDPNDSHVNYRRYSLDSNNSSAIGWVMSNRVAPTNLSVASTSSWSVSDITIYDWDQTNKCNANWHSSTTGSGVIGKTICNNKVGAACDRHLMYLDTSWTSSASTTNLRKVACHETGHMFGINHNTHGGSLSSCMNTYATSGTTGYSSHEINDMINFVWN